jgi:hypothetical protein
MKLNFIENREIFLIKLLAIAYATILFIMSGLAITKYSDKYIMKKFVEKDNEKEKKKNKIRIAIELSSMIGILSIFAYIAKNILQEIPFPLDGKFGFNYLKVKEVSGGSLVLWSLIAFSPIITSKINILRT